MSAYAMPVGGIPLVRVNRREAAPARRARVLSRRGLAAEGTATHVDGEGQTGSTPAAQHVDHQPESGSVNGSVERIGERIGHRVRR